MAYIGQTPTAIPLVAGDITDGIISEAKLAADAVSLAKMKAGTDGNIISYDASGNPVAIATGSDGQVLTSAGAGQPCAFETLTTGKVVQVVNFQSAAVATGTTAISRDTSTPQISEGVEYMTLAVTPTNASNKLYVEVTMFLGGDWNLVMTALLFNTTYHDTNALAAASVIVADEDHEHVLNFSYYVTAGTTSATTFRVRGGQLGSATTTFNGRAEAVEHGSAIKSSITITEIAV